MPNLKSVSFALKYYIWKSEKCLFLLYMKNELKNRYGSWCLVAGAAEGLGSAFSQSLAARGMNLILVDLQKDPLDSLAQELESSFGIQVKPLHLDLASEDSVGLMMELIREVSCRMLIYNAAFSRVQKFTLNDPAMLDRYINVNMRTPIQLIHAFCHLHSEEEDQRKGILLMSSLAGSWGTQLLGPYGGSKAFNHILAESLHYELKGEGFDVLACIAGATSTPGYLASLPPGKMKTQSVMHPEKVVEAGLGALGHRPFVIPGFLNKLIYFLLTRILPRRTSLRIMNRAVGNLYRERS
jgi:short-subunit dehydrogenase